MVVVLKIVLFRYFSSSLFSAVYAVYYAHTAYPTPQMCGIPHSPSAGAGRLPHRDMRDTEQPSCPDQSSFPSGGRPATQAALDLAGRSLNLSVERWLGRAMPVAVPKILHQTWKSCTLPRRQQFWRDECRRKLSSDWSLRLHTDADNRAFIAREFPQYLGMYDSYDAHIKRVDAVRYFYLYRYGGVYMDLDFTCLRPLEELPLTPGRVALGFQHGTIHTMESVANAFIAAPPRHPFMAMLIRRLNATARVTYKGRVHPMKSTGCAWLTAAVKSWQQQFGHTGVLRIGHPGGYKLLADAAAANRTVTALEGAALTVHLRPRIFNSDFIYPQFHPCKCDPRTRCDTPRELARCPQGLDMDKAVVTTFWTGAWVEQLQREMNASLRAAHVVGRRKAGK